MLILTKLDDSKVLVSLEAIKYIEATPDSLIRFLNGDSIIVKESFEEIEQQVVFFKRKILNSMD